MEAPGIINKTKAHELLSRYQSDDDEKALHSLRNTGRSCFPDIRSSPAVKKSTAW